MILETKDLTKTYSRQGIEFDAVNGVDFSMDAGEIAILTGPSGCGKSTFFHLITGITNPTRGKVFLEGKEVTDLSSGEWASVRAEKISYILQGDSLLPNFTILENICLPHRLAGLRKDLESSAMALLEEFGLQKMTQDYPANLSGGEKRRVAIARAFVHDPLLVVADEPTSDLDEENTALILDFFEKQRLQGKAILISTHDRSCLRDGVTHYVMKKGIIERNENNGFRENQRN